MTVAVQTPFNSYAANGITTVFGFAFKVLQSADLVVQTIDANGAPTTKTIGVDYTVSGVGAGSGGTVAFLAAPASGLTVKIFRSSQLARSTDYQDNGDLLAAILNTDIDRLWLALQELLAGNQVAANSVRAQPGESLNTLGAPLSRVNKLLGFNAASGQPEMSTFTMTQVAAVIAAVYAASAGPLDALSFLQAGAGAESRSAQDKVRESVSILDFIPVAEHAAIKAGTSVFDCYSSIMEAINSATYIGTFIGSNNQSGPAIYFPPGIYCVNSTIQLERRVTLFGDGSGMAYGDAAILKFPADVSGIIVHAVGTGPNVATTSGSASVLRGLALVSLGGSDVTKHGVWMRSRAFCENLYIENFPGDGYHIVATSGGGGTIEGNANNWKVIGGRTNDCGVNGFFTDGADVNAGYCEGLDSVSNSGWGIYDSSFLGNTYIACHVAGNTLGSYKSDSANARNIFIGCYSESGAASDILAPSMVIGGLHGAGFTVGTTAANYLGESGVHAPDGAAAGPSLSFASEPTTGFYRPSASSLRLAMLGAEKMRWTTNGGAKFTTNGTYFGISSDYHEMVQHSASLFSSVDYLTSAAYTGAGKLISCGTAGGTSWSLLSASNLAGLCFTVLGNGNAQNTNNSYGAISDAKLKENIAAAPSYWDKFKRYEFVNYTLKADPEHQKMLGLVAQQAEQVSPGVVYETPDYEEVEVVRENGETTMERRPLGTSTKAVKYSIVALQAEVVLQEAQRRVEQLESQVAALLAKG